MRIAVEKFRDPHSLHIAPGLRKSRGTILSEPTGAPDRPHRRMTDTTARFDKPTVERDRRLDRPVSRLDEIENPVMPNSAASSSGRIGVPSHGGPSSPTAARRRHHEMRRTCVGPGESSCFFGNARDNQSDSDADWRVAVCKGQPDNAEHAAEAGDFRLKPRLHRTRNRKFESISLQKSLQTIGSSPAGAMCVPSNRAPQKGPEVHISPATPTRGQTAIVNAALHRQSAHHSVRHHRFRCTRGAQNHRRGDRSARPSATGSWLSSVVWSTRCVVPSRCRQAWRALRDGTDGHRIEFRSPLGRVQGIAG